MCDYAEAERVKDKANLGDAPAFMRSAWEESGVELSVELRGSPCIRGTKGTPVHMCVTCCAGVAEFRREA